LKAQVYVMCDKSKLVGVLFVKEHSTTGLMTPSRPQQPWYVSALPGVLMTPDVIENHGCALA